MLTKDLQARGSELCKPVLAPLMPAWEGNTLCLHTYTLPAQPAQGGTGWPLDLQTAFPSLTAAFEQPTCSPFICSVVAISPELPIISLSSSKNVGSLETQLSLAEISFSQQVVNAPIMLAFLILCYYYPRLPFSLQRIKRPGFQDPHNGSVHLPVVGQTIPLCFSFIGNLSVVGAWLHVSLLSGDAEVRAGASEFIGDFRSTCLGASLRNQHESAQAAACSVSPVKDRHRPAEPVGLYISQGVRSSDRAPL